MDNIISGFIFKGTVDYVDLLMVEGANEGDMYVVLYDGKSSNNHEKINQINATYVFNGREYILLNKNEENNYIESEFVKIRGE